MGRKKEMGYMMRAKGTYVVAGTLRGKGTYVNVSEEYTCHWEWMVYMSLWVKSTYVNESVTTETPHANHWHCYDHSLTHLWTQSPNAPSNKTTHAATTTQTKPNMPMQRGDIPVGGTRGHWLIVRWIVCAICQIRLWLVFVLCWDQTNQRRYHHLECYWYCHGKCVSLLGDWMCVFHSECASHRVSGLSTMEGQQQLGKQGSVVTSCRRAFYWGQTRSCFGLPSLDSVVRQTDI